MNTLALDRSLEKHDRTFISAATYWLTKAAFHIAPAGISKLIREKGFKVKPFHLSDEQRALQKQAHSFNLEFNNNSIKVFEWGEGPVVLLVHGWSGRALQFESLIRTLLKQGYKVVAFDHKGHGDSSSGFSSFPEVVRSTELVAAFYGNTLHGIVAHSMGANATFKVCENHARKLKLAAIAPLGDFVEVLDTFRIRLGIYEKLYAQVIRQIETENGLLLSDLNRLDYQKISRHDVLLVHDKFDKVNKISVSQEIHNNLTGSTLVQTENQGHSRILNSQEVLDRIAAHLSAP